MPHTVYFTQTRRGSITLNSLAEVVEFIDGKRGLDGVEWYTDDEHGFRVVDVEFESRKAERTYPPLQDAAVS